MSDKWARFRLTAASTVWPDDGWTMSRQNHLSAAPSPTFSGPVTLQNCDKEPIHIPGAIQPHGVLLAWDGLGTVTHVSVNANEIWREPPVPGEHWVATLDRIRPEFHALAQLLRCAPGEQELPMHRGCHTPAGWLDAIWCTHAFGTILELEWRPDEEASCVEASVAAIHALAGRVARAPDLERMLDWTVQGLRDATGFDRVMAYRFRHDDSGEVVAEALAPELDPFLGRVYPASDIPAQARRLYTVKLLRGIADVHGSPVALLANEGTAPLDMSHSELRSVSHVHIEYLQNMGVGASLSLSIVVQGRLWGLVACHHMGPHRLAHAQRLALEVLSHLLGAKVDEWQRRETQERQSRLAAQRARLSLELARREDTFEVLCEQARQWVATWQADAWLVALDDDVRASDPALLSAWPSLSGWLQQQPMPLVALHDVKQWPSPGTQMAGLLALRFSEVQQAWVCLLRKEQELTLRWGGKPEKLVKIGPMGARLTPRGSFDEWREVVQGTSVPWGADDRVLAEEMRQTLHRVHAELSLERKSRNP